MPTPAYPGQRVNCGGPIFVDSMGNGWASDKAFSTGSWGYTAGSAKSSTKAVAGTIDDPLYQRWRDNPLGYKFTVPNGTYQILLRFADFEFG